MFVCNLFCFAYSARSSGGGERCHPGIRESSFARQSFESSAASAIEHSIDPNSAIANPIMPIPTRRGSACARVGCALRISTPRRQGARLAARNAAFAQRLAMLLEEQMSFLQDARLRGKGLRRLATGGIRLRVRPLFANQS